MEMVLQGQWATMLRNYEECMLYLRESLWEEFETFSIASWSSSVTVWIGVGEDLESLELRCLAKIVGTSLERPNVPKSSPQRPIASLTLQIFPECC